MTDTPLPPISSQTLDWENFDRGRFGCRTKHLTLLGERYDRSATREHWDGED
jgi:hypothetical protein